MSHSTNKIKYTLHENLKSVDGPTNDNNVDNVVIILSCDEGCAAQLIIIFFQPIGDI